MPTDGPALSDPRHEKRKVASRREWTALRAAKDGPCRVCEAPAPNELHHLISRARGGNDPEAWQAVAAEGRKSKPKQYGKSRRHALLGDHRHVKP